MALAMFRHLSNVFLAVKRFRINRKKTASTESGVFTERMSSLRRTRTREEREFLRLVREADAAGCRYLVQVHPGRVSVNCSDLSGETALEVAVGLHNLTLVEELLSLEGLSDTHVYAAILRAVQEDQLPILEVLMEVYERRFKFEPGQEASWAHSDFGMTPLMSAAAEGNVEITRFLLDKGHIIDKPHSPKCRCSHPKCVKRQTEGETLFQSLSRINAYRALASSCHMMLTSDDPILTAFQLSKELRSLANYFPEHKKEYSELAEVCSKFAADLLDQCRDTREVKTILVQRQGFPDPRPRLFSRLQLAIVYKQKQFVVHPSCQQVIRETWVEGQTNWVTWSARNQLFYVLAQALLTPLAALAYVILPTRFILKPIRVPLNRFIHSVTCYLMFLVLILCSILYGTNHENQSPVQRGIEVAIGVWVVGHVWEILIDMYLLGVGTFFRSWWMVYDLIMFTGFLISDGIWLLLVTFDLDHFVSQPVLRMYWHWYHPFLIAEGIFALASILAFGRLLLWYQIHAKMGPLGTSLRYMLGDVFRFLLVVFVFLFAFSIGINSVYRNYRDSVFHYSNGTNRSQPQEFTTFQTTMKTLFWAALGMANPDVAAIVVNGSSTAFTHRFSELLGYSMWALYHLVTVIVLLNMLIAMMANSFQRVQTNADTEWKFNRSSVLLAFFDKQSALPPPFNLLPSVYGIIWFFTGLKRMCLSKRRGTMESQCCYWETENEREIQRKYEDDYQHLLGELIRRYVHSQESLQRRQGVQSLPSSVLQRIKSDILAELIKSGKFSGAEGLSETAT